MADQGTHLAVFQGIIKDEEPFTPYNRPVQHWGSQYGIVCEY